MDFSTIAIESCTEYLKHVKPQETSVKNVKCLEEGYFSLELLHEIHFNDNIRLHINNDTYAQPDFLLDKYDSKKRILYIRILTSSVLKPMFEKPEELNNVSVVNDLRFLIENAKAWYKKYHGSFVLPTEIPMDSVTPLIPGKASSDQSEAIELVLSEPLSYVWGAPGTGKTKMVLSTAVENLLTFEKHILITAPTNVALEQTLYGMLPVLEEHGIDIKEQVLRLGTPTAVFFERYACVCQDKKAETQYLKLCDRIAATKQRICELKEIKVGYPRYLATMNALKVIPEILSTLSELDEEDFSISSDLSSLLSKITVQSITITKLRNDRDKALIQVKKAENEIWVHSIGIKKVFGRRQREAATQARERALTIAHDHTAQLEVLEKEIAVQQNQEQYLRQKLGQIKAEKEKLIKSITEIAEQTDWKSLIALTKELEKGIKTTREKISALFTKNMSKMEEKRSTYESISITDVDREIEELNNYILSGKGELESLKPFLTESRLSHVHIVAATLDTAIIYLSPEKGFKPEHIFLDEAGYASLIKGAMMTAFKCPITLLGDHMQLPPICEIGDLEFEQGKYLPCVSWAQSAIYIEQINGASIDEIAEKYLKQDSPKFSQLKKAVLTHTYRFGTKLASLLSKHLYNRPLYGNNEHPTEIQYCHASRRAGTKPRENLSEEKAICMYMLSHRNENIGIITPYVNQRNLIADELKEIGIPDDDVLTIHRSQGREWDTVIISISDTQNMWFTDSLRPLSKKLLNTAVSRVKKKLIIFCDSYYWKHQSDQFITELLRIAEEIHVTTPAE